MLLLYYTDLMIFTAGNDMTDDPYGIFEPIVNQSNLDGTFIIYYKSHFKFCSKPNIFDKWIMS